MELPDEFIRVSGEDHRWLTSKKNMTKIPIKSIISIAIDVLKGESETELSRLVRDKNKRK